MKKSLTLSLIIAISPIIGGLYGIIHDQITYTISSEYYTKFKFIQFEFADSFEAAEKLPHQRLFVAGVGFFATLWMGLLLGLILGLVGLKHKKSKSMFNITIKAMLLVSLVSLIIGILGLFYGKYYLANKAIGWWFPENLVDRTNFIAVGSMHNFAYWGAFIGLILAVIYSVNQHKKSKTEIPNC